MCSFLLIPLLSYNILFVCFLCLFVFVCLFVCLFVLLLVQQETKNAKLKRVSRDLHFESRISRVRRPIRGQVLQPGRVMKLLASDWLADTLVTFYLEGETVAFFLIFLI